MSVESLFLYEISKLKRRVFITSFFRILLWACSIFMFILFILLVLEKAGFSTYRQFGSDFIILGGVILFISLLFAIVKRSNFLNALIDIDARLKLQERLSTAYEYQKSGTKSDFSGLLMQDAANKLHQLSRKQIFPAKFTILHLVLILLMITNVALYSSIYLASVFKPTHVEKAHTLLRDFTMKRSGGNQGKIMKRNKGYYKKLDQLTQTFNDRSISQERQFAKLNSFLKEIQGEQTRLEDELGARLNAVKIDEMPVHNIAGLEDLTSSKLEKLKKILHKALKNQIPNAINENIETLQELYSMEELLSQIIDDFSQGLSDKKQFADSSGNETQTSQFIDDDAERNDNTKRTQIPGKLSGRKHERESADGPPGSGQSHGNDRGENDDIGNSEEYSSSAGRGKSSGQKKPSHEIGKSTGPGIKDKMISSQVKKYLVHIRSLSTIGESRLKEEKIIRTYRQEIENILQKEDMPPNYREYIKQYFISIGLKPQEN